MGNGSAQSVPLQIQTAAIKTEDHSYLRGTVCSDNDQLPEIRAVQRKEENTRLRKLVKFENSQKVQQQRAGKAPFKNIKE